MDFKGFFNSIDASFKDFLSSGLPTKAASTGLIIILILILFKIIEIIIPRLAKGLLPQLNNQFARRVIRYTGFVVAGMTLLNKLGIDLSALLGAAGIAGIAIGFAAQTSVSNIISGLFLISEKAFVVGDVIQVAEISGIVQSIDLLSVKIQTHDNRFVRIPNETIIKSNVVNVTRFPIRRFDLWLHVDYSTDLDQVEALLREAARENVFVLHDPEPLVVFDKLDTSRINVLLGVWFEKRDFLKVKNSIIKDVLKRFAAAGIRIPVPQLAVDLEAK